MRVGVLRGNCQETVPCEVRERHVGMGGGSCALGGAQVIRGDGGAGGWRGCMAVCAIPHTYTIGIKELQVYLIQDLQ